MKDINLYLVNTSMIYEKQMGMKITGTAKITVGFASVIVCFALVSVDFFKEAVGFVLI